MKRVRLSGFQAVSVVVLAASVYMVAAQVVSRSSGIAPGEKDRRRSERTLTPQGGVDDRVRVPDPRLVSGTGVIEPRTRETKVAAAAAGRIARVVAAEGQQVGMGDMLVELEAGPERAAAESARGEVESARRDLQRVKAGERPEVIAAGREEMAAAQAKAAQSSAIVERLRGLAVKDLVTRDEFDRAGRQAEQDASAALAAAARFEAAANGARDEDVAVQEARLAEADKRLREREVAVQLRRVRAPSAGTVLQIKYRAGEYYTPGGEPLLLLGDLSRRRARIDVDERDIGRVRLGEPAYVTAPAFPDRRFPAKVAEVGLRIGRKNIRTDDPKERIDTKILEVVLDLEGDAPELVPGLRVTAVIGQGAGR